MKRLLLLLLPITLGIGCSDAEPEPDPNDPTLMLPDPSMMSGAGMTAKPLLSVGDQLPPLECAGWINGSAPQFDTDEGRLLLIDVWGGWCVGVHDCASGLLDVHREFADRGVSFVSLTNDSQQAVETFVAANDVPWPHGYGATTSLLNELGARNTNMAMTPGYEAWPTLYLTDSAGRILWTDARQRTTHEDPQKFVSMLTAAIEEHLAGSRTPPQSEP